MLNAYRSILFALLWTTNAVCSAAPQTTFAENNAELTVATWNIEHLAFPASEGCRPRSDKELSQLKNYAESLSADIVAVQEVASIEALEQIFPSNQWQIVISERENSESYECREGGMQSTQQKVAYAVKNGIKIDAVNSISEFSIDNPGLRHGLELLVSSDFGPLSLLNVHMKSGCFVDNFARSDSSACITFGEQAPVLDAWIEEQEAGTTPYIVLGDFNHRLSAPYNHLTRLLSNNSDGSPSALEISTRKLIGCHPYYPAPIDYIITGHLSDSHYQKQARFHLFDNMEADAMLSDHCALSLDIRAKEHSFSTALDWVTTSAEYRFIARAIYDQAIEYVKSSNFGTGWTVVMDVDETILDNSGYQKNLERNGESYTDESWDQWVRSEQADLVPGAKLFIEAVIEKGGTLALITNRNRGLDQYTWNNLVANDLPIDINNTCLMGRNSEDKEAIGSNGVINDKDLRRMQIESGRAQCFEKGQARHDKFEAVKIVMQVGDNIEDFKNVVQEDADVEGLLHDRNTLILLPNPMYGSW